MGTQVLLPNYDALILMGTGAGGAALLKTSWDDPTGAHSGYRWAGWFFFVAGLLAAGFVLGSGAGIATAAVCMPVGVLVIVVHGASRRVARAGRTVELAPEPLETHSKAWRGWLKALLAGPLGMLAAMGLSFCYASWAPGAVQTRLLIAALLVPALWGLAMTWTLADQRLVRSAAVLVGTAVGGFGLALLRGVA